MGARLIQQATTYQNQQAVSPAVLNLQILDTKNVTKNESDKTWD